MKTKRYLEPYGSFFDVELGDIVIRHYDSIKYHCKVFYISKEYIFLYAPFSGGSIPCVFDRATGLEYDPDLPLGIEFNIAISRLIRE